MMHLTDEIIASHLTPRENYIYGFADLRGLLDEKFNGFNSGIVIGRLLNNKIIDNIIDGPTKEYYKHYRETNKELEKLTDKISYDLSISGIESLKIKPTVSISDIESKYSGVLRTAISHKMVATRAGLGWIGKTDLFISKNHGPRLRLVSMLLKSPLFPKSKPINKSRCGSCNICVEVCPAKAANGLLWDISVKREEFFDAWKCRNQCAEFGKSRLGMDTRVCGICVAACPIGQKNQ
jgi:epoxyqueuosine reductase